jgi:hypothetical protein
VLAAKIHASAGIVIAGRRSGLPALGIRCAQCALIMSLFFSLVFFDLCSCCVWIVVGTYPGYVLKLSDKKLEVSLF